MDDAIKKHRRRSRRRDPLFSASLLKATEDFAQCELCDKIFLDENYLKAHELRRHRRDETPAEEPVEKAAVEAKVSALIEDLKASLSESIASVERKLSTLEKDIDSKRDQTRIVDELAHKFHDETSTAIGALNLQMKKELGEKLEFIERRHSLAVQELKADVAELVESSRNVQLECLDKINRLEHKTESQMELFRKQENIIEKLATETRLITAKLSAPQIQKTPVEEKRAPPKSFISQEKSSESDESFEDFQKQIPSPVTSNLPTKSTKKNIAHTKNGAFIPTKSKNHIQDIKNRTPSPISPPKLNKNSSKNIQVIDTTKEPVMEKRKIKKTNKKLSEPIEKKSNKSSVSNEKMPLTPKNQEKIAKALRADFHILLNQHLEQLGISADCKKVSSDAFEAHMESLTNKRRLMAKKYKSFSRTRNSIARTVNLNMEKNQNNINSKEITTPVPPSKLNKSLVFVGNIFSNMKSNVSKSTESLKMNFKRGLDRSRGGSLDMLDTASERNYSSDSTRKLSAKSILAMVEAKQYSAKSSPARNQPSDDSVSTGEETPENASPDLQKLLTSPIRKPASPMSVSAVEQDVIHSTPFDMKNRRFSKAASSDTIENLSSSDDLSMDPMFEQKMAKHPLGRKSLSDGNFAQNNLIVSPKGVLKTVSSANSLMKKKVLFNLNPNASNESLGPEDPGVDVTSEKHEVKVQINQGSNDTLNVGMPIPAPRLHVKKAGNSESDLDLSDWSLEDLLHDKHVSK